jgi:excisionase family DNA binding protein
MLYSEVTAMKDRISVEEIAQILGYHKTYVYYLLKNGTIPNKKLLGRLVIFRDEFDEWLSDCESRIDG